MNLPKTEFNTSQFLDADSSIQHQIFLGVTPAQDRAGQFALYAKEPGQDPARVTPVLTCATGMSQSKYLPLYSGASTDLSRIVISMSGSCVLLPGEPVPDQNRNGRAIYEISGSGSSSPVVQRVNVDTGGHEIAPACGAYVGAWGVGRAANSISADGRKIFFSTAPNATASYQCSTQVGIFARVDGTQTVEITHSECDRTAEPDAAPPVTACAPVAGNAQYDTASSNGRRVFFTSPDQLASTDTDGTRDLYMYDFGGAPGHRLTQISAGDLSVGSPGAGANVVTVLRASDDGGRVYFVAEGQLTSVPNSQHKTAQPGANNFYVYDVNTGHTAFIGTLDPSADYLLTIPGNVDAGVPVQLSDPTGRYLVFTTYAPLTADDTDSSSDVYRYDAQTQDLQRLSIGNDGYGSDGNDAIDASIRGPDFQYARVSASSAMRAISADGSRVVFATNEALQSGDDNDASDAYEWHDGHVGLITTGHGEGLMEFPPVISADGSTVVFITADALLPDQDTDTAADLYAARLGADVDVPRVVNPPVCTSNDCQLVPAAPPLLSNPVTPLFLGLGDLIHPAASPVNKQELKVSRVGTVHGRSTRIKVTVPSKGKIRTSGSGLRRSHKTAKKAGAYRVTVKLSKRAKRTLKRKHRVKVRVTVRFTPQTGKMQRVRVHATFKAKRHHKSSSRGSRRATGLSDETRQGR